MCYNDVRPTMRRAPHCSAAGCSAPIHLAWIWAQDGGLVKQPVAAIQSPRRASRNAPAASPRVSGMALAAGAWRRGHPTGSLAENIKMFRENHRFSGLRGEPVGSHLVARATFRYWRALLKIRKTSEKMARFHASRLGNQSHLLPTCGCGKPHRSSPPRTATECQNSREKRSSRSKTEGDLVA